MVDTVGILEVAALAATADGSPQHHDLMPKYRIFFGLKPTLRLDRRNQNTNDDAQKRGTLTLSDFVS